MLKIYFCTYLICSVVHTVIFSRHVGFQHVKLHVLCYALFVYLVSGKGSLHMCLHFVQTNVFTPQRKVVQLSHAQLVYCTVKVMRIHTKLYYIPLSYKTAGRLYGHRRLQAAIQVYVWSPAHCKLHVQCDFPIHVSRKQQIKSATVKNVCAVQCNKKRSTFFIV